MNKFFTITQIMIAGLVFFSVALSARCINGNDSVQMNRSIEDPTASDIYRITQNPGESVIKLKSDYRPGVLLSGKVLYDNGPLINSAGTGAGGADESVLQSFSLGMNILGFGHQFSVFNLVADDFTVSGKVWNVDTIAFFAY